MNNIGNASNYTPNKCCVMSVSYDYADIKIYFKSPDITAAQKLWILLQMWVSI